MTLHLQGPAAGAFAPRQTPPTTAAASGVFDRRLSVYNLKPSHLRRTRAALGKARAGTGVCTIATVGDSTTAGTGTTLSTQPWPSVLASMLVTSGIPSTGSGIVAASGGPYTDPRWVYSGAWGDRSAAGYCKFSVTTGNTGTFTSTNTGTTVNLYYSNHGQNFSVAIDGGAPVTVTVTGAETLGVYTVTGLANTTHTVVATNTGTRIELIGCEVRSATNGLRMFNAGIGSRKVIDVADVSVAKWLTMGYLPVGNSSTTGFNADLVTLNVGLNDVGSATDPATFKANYQTGITNLRLNGADLVLVVPNPASGYDLTPYTKAIYELADTNDLPVIDLTDRFGSYSSANTQGIMFDSLHPNPAGYADVARTVLTALAL